jgi:hypothetical protein
MSAVDGSEPRAKCPLPALQGEEVVGAVPQSALIWLVACGHGISAGRGGSAGVSIVLAQDVASDYETT